MLAIKETIAQGKPKVLHIITKLLRGGAEEKTLNTIYGLKDNYEFYFGYGAESEDTQRRKLRENGIEVHYRVSLFVALGY